MIIVGVVPETTRFGFRIKNGSATLVDGHRVVVSIPEERLARVKHAPGSKLAVDFILKHYLNGLPDGVVTSTCCEPAGNAVLDQSHQPLFLGSVSRPSPSHHYSHAVCAYGLSPFERSLIVVADAGGNTFSSPRDGSSWWTVGREQLSVFLAEGRAITKVGAAFDEPYDCGVGEHYRAVTRALGLGGQTSAGKTMGLSAFGDASRLRKGFFTLGPEGAVRAEVRFTDPEGVVGQVVEFLKQNGASGFMPHDGASMTQLHADVAAHLQKSTQDALAHITRHYAKRLGVRNVCMAGGVALNCAANSAVLDLDEVDSVFVPPCCGDDGQSVGNALLPLFQAPGAEKPPIEWPGAFLGPDQAGLSRQKVDAFVKQSHARWEVISDDPTHSRVATLLAQGNVLGWFDGRSEIGPRALGARSILCDPRRVRIRSRLSHLVKGRAEFRPYAASVLREEAEEWFDCPTMDPYMLFLARQKQRTLDVAPVLYHPDGTCRLQCVGEEAMSFAHLLRSFKQVTGLPFLVNTSFNAQGKPIVEMPYEAFALAEETALDGVVLGQWIVMKVSATTVRDLQKSPTLLGSPEDVISMARINYAGWKLSSREYFGLQRDFCDWILTGRKCTTVRFARDAIDIPARSVLPVVARPDGEVLYSVAIKRLRVLPYSALTWDDARRDGFHSISELRGTLERLYGHIPEAHPVTVYDVDVHSDFQALTGSALTDRY
jgi:carbamoyltransferase